MDGSGFVHGNDVVIVRRRWYAKEFEKHQLRKWDVEVQTFGLRDDDGKQLRIFNKILAWDPTELGTRRTRNMQ